MASHYGGPEPTPLDLSHHLSEIAKARQDSPLKGLQKYFGDPRLISMAGGLPSPVYFPFANIGGDVLVPDSFPLTTEKSSLGWFWNLFASKKEHTVPVSVPKYSTDPKEITLSTALQYSRAIGLPALAEFMKQFSARVYKPASPEWTTLIHTGNTDAWHRIVLTLCNPGEGILAAEWTYPSAMTTAAPYGARPVPISMDGQGIRSDALRKTLAEWDVEARGMPRPHVMYTVPVGQNPSGATMGLQRKKEIYAICVEYDVIICEDDPYFFLQEGPYVPKSERVEVAQHKDEESFIASLEPSYVSIDVQGRVIRMDTFSKTVAPGSRLGWFTCSPLFAERLERSTQAPCGFGQSLVTKLLQEWKYEGYMRWLQSLGVQYKMRRDTFIDLLADEFHLDTTVAQTGLWEMSTVYMASDKINRENAVVSSVGEKFSVNRQTMFTFVPPTSGMFVWMKLNLENHPSTGLYDQETLEMQLWTACAEGGVLFAPGAIFAANGSSSIGNEVGHFRVSFSLSEPEEMKRAVKIFAAVLHEFFKDPSSS